VRTAFSATRHVPWALNIPKMHLWPSPGCKHIFSAFRAQGKCPVAANLVLFLWNQKVGKCGYFWTYCMLPCSCLL